MHMAAFQSTKFCFTLFVILVWSFCDTISAYRSQSWCQRQPSFSFRQRKLCDKVPGLHTAIKKGLEMGQTECERLFKKSRWNCTLLGERSFLHRAPDGTKEAAFTAAIMSSALAFSVAKACVKKDVSECSCESVKRPAGDKSWLWQGCSVNIRYGSFLAERIIMSGKTNHSKSNSMMKHNVRVGLRILKDSRLISCSLGKQSKLRSCHIILPSFHKISNIIKSKYLVATKVIPVQRGTRKSYFLRTTGRYRGRPNGKRPKGTTLVFLDSSPSYCYRQDEHLIPGTSGRQCRRNSNQEDDCDLLCCGRGYKRNVIVKERFCLCKQGKENACDCKICTDVIIENRCL